MRVALDDQDAALRIDGNSRRRPHVGVFGDELDLQAVVEDLGGGIGGKCERGAKQDERHGGTAAGEAYGVWSAIVLSTEY
jgi:hypothetical protein